MMEIKTVSLSGLGALGAMFGSQMLGCMPKGNFRVIEDGQRMARYRQEGIYVNANE